MEPHKSTVAVSCGQMVDQLSSLGKLAVAIAFLVGIYLVIRGLVGLLGRSEVPFLKRRRMFAKVALGAFLVSLPPALQMSTVNARLDHVEITKATEF